MSLAGSRLTFDDLDSAIAGSRLRGRVALTLDDERNVEGEVGLDALDLAPAFALAIGAAGHDAAEPLGSGLLKGWRGRIAFQALRGALPGGGELRPVSGTVRSDGQSLTFDAIKGGIGGGEATANIDAKQGANGIALNARVQLRRCRWRGAALSRLAMPAGRTSMQMTLASQGRSASALTGALSGSGTVTLESARIAGLDPRAFDAAIRASDNGQATDDIRLRQIVEPVLSAGALSVKSAQIPFNIRDGRLRVGATTLDAEGARAIVSGGYDIPADQADIRAILASTAAGSGDQPSGNSAVRGGFARCARSHRRRRGAVVMAGGEGDRSRNPPAGFDRARRAAAGIAGVDSAARARLCRCAGRGRRINRFPDADFPAAIRAGLRRSPRSALRIRRLRRPPSSPDAPRFVSQQVAPLPPPIEVRPAPGVVRQPKPRPPLVLTPPAAGPPR